MPKIFPGFTDLFTIHDPLSSGLYRGMIDFEDVAIELSRAERPLPREIAVAWAMGADVPAHVTWTTFAHPLIVHAEVLEILTTNRFTGWAAYPVAVLTRQGLPAPDFFILGISGRCGPRDLSRSEIELRQLPGGWIPYFRGYYFAPDTWDGSDLFMHYPDRLGKVSLHRFCTEPVRQALKAAKIRNLRIERLTESLVDASVYTIGLKHVLPADFEARVSAAYQRAGVPRPSWV